MKTTKILLGALRVSALVALFAAAVPAQAQIVVNVEFQDASAGIGTYAGLGAASDSGTYWNGIVTPYGGHPSISNSGALLASNGVTSTTVDFSLTAPGNIYTQDATAGSNFAKPLLNEWEKPNGTVHVGTFALTGLTDGGKYNLYFYVGNGGGFSQGETFTIGATTLTAQQTGSLSSFVAGKNYVEFAGLIADGSGDITATFQNPTSTGGWNGFQLQAVAAPEPASLATMSLGGMALLLLLKRFKKQSV